MFSVTLRSGERRWRSDYAMKWTQQ